MTTHRKPKWLTTTLTVATVTAVLAGGAYAYWSATGTGSGAVAAQGTVALTLSPAAPTLALAPGGTTNVVVTATNTNTTIAHITSLALDTTQGTNGFAVDTGHSTCNLDALTYTAQTNSGFGWNVPQKYTYNGAPNGALNMTLYNALSMSTSAANTCQGAIFTVYLAAS